MVAGLELFAERFEAFQNQYVLIGGAACYTAMNAVGAEFRATKDLDVVLCLEEMTSDFIKTFWQFVRDGVYQNQQSETCQKQYYRFSKPSTSRNSGSHQCPVMMLSLHCEKSTRADRYRPRLKTPHDRGLQHFERQTDQHSSIKHAGT